MANGSPFIPRFGAVPPVFVGREKPLADLADVAGGNLNRKCAASLLLGTRGMGKTTLMQVVTDNFSERGWLVLRVAAEPAGGLLEDLGAQAAGMLHEIHHGRDPRARARISGVGVAGFSVSTERVEPPPFSADLRQMLGALGAYALQQDAGLLVTADEIHDADLDEIRRFGNIFRIESSGRGLPIAFVGAGLLEIYETLLSGTHTTFLNRCEKYELDLLSRADATKVLVGSIMAGEGSVCEAALAAMLDAAAGHPYMLQAVGEAVWDAAADPASGITGDEATVGIAQARCAMGPDIYAPTWPHLSAVHRDLLTAALSSDDTPIATLASAAGRPHDETAEDCAALARRGFFQTPQAGSVRFAHPEARRFVEAQGLWQGRDVVPRQRLADVEQAGPYLT